MKKILCILSFSFLALSFEFCNADWVQTNGPYGGYITCLAINGSNIFAGTDGGGVYLSSNNGSSWAAVNTGLTDNYVNALAISGSNIFAGTDMVVVCFCLQTMEALDCSEYRFNKYYMSNALAISGNNIFAGT